MSVRTMAKVWEASKHAGSDLLMMLAIADFADDDGRAYPSVGTLAQKCRMSPRNVNLILNQLRASGELEIKANEGPRGTNRYRIRLDAQLLKPASPPTPEACFTPEEAFTLKPPSPTPEAGFPKPLKPASDEPLLNHQEPPTNGRATIKTKSRSAEHPLFAEFYAAYPRRVARANAVKAFNALAPDRGMVDAMLKAIQRQRLAERCSSGDVRFVPHPATWLNGRRWEDEVGAGDGSPQGDDVRPTWATSAGFANRYEAENAGCYPHNAQSFRGGRRVGVTA